MPLLEPGQMIRDTYEVERYLAEGAFAEVYRVKHRFLGRQAMKVFKRTGMTQKELDEVMAEAVLLSRLAHPNIVQVFDANTLVAKGGEYGYFTMENVPGGSLDRFWRSHGLRLVPIETTVDILKQVCRGLALAHRSDPPLIHRDIKPQNILVGYATDGLRARVSDFGLAKQVNELTLHATAAGTLAFKPPEVFQKQKGDSVAADIWALGVTLYWLLTDTVPFEVDPLIGWVNAATFRKKPVPPSRLNIHANASLDHIVAKCLSPDPKDRFANADALLKVLDQWPPGKEAESGVDSCSVSMSRFSKDALGPGYSSPNPKKADGMVKRALELAWKEGNLKEAADLMEEAFNIWPDLREKHAQKVTLWRRGVIG